VPAADPISIERSPDGAVTLHLRGVLDQAGVAGCWNQAMASVLPTPPRSLTLDLGGVTRCDSTGLGLIARLRDTVQESGGTVRVVSTSGDLDRLIALARTSLQGQRATAPRGELAEVGHATLRLLDALLAQVEFAGAVMLCLLRAIARPRLFRFGDMLQVSARAIVDAVPVVCLLGFLIGAIIAFQTMSPMSRYGAQLQVAQIVGFSMVRELGPLMTAIILAGRTGSAFAAEIGTMKVTEEISALQTFGLDPVRFLVVPRMTPVTLLMPFLSVFATMMGLLGGYLVMASDGFSLSIYVQTIVDNLTIHDFVQGLAKAAVFGVLVTGTGCHSGLLTLEGPGAVGASTTRAVVSGIVLVVVADGILGAVFFVLGI
jgi:phospholipid/cholesterol/gamma-HCH transport system permease protein